MAGVLLALFPILLLFYTPLAWVALGLAIVLLVNKRLGAARRPARPRFQNDASV
jgi:hypothetical protein